MRCDEIQAETKALFEGRKEANGVGYRFSKKYVVVDPVSNTTRSYLVRIVYEPELGRNVIETVSSIPNDTDTVDALGIYNELLIAIFEQMEQTKVPNENFKIFNTPFSNPGSPPDRELDIQAWSYNFLRGQALYQTNFESYNWMLQGSNVNTVIGELSVMIGIDGIGLISTSIKNKLADIISGVPLQYAIRFKNGDTITFMFDCICSIPLLPLHETARSADGKKLNNSAQSSGGQENYYNFYEAMFNNGQSLQQVCVVVYTGEENNMVPQKVCWIAYF